MTDITLIAIPHRLPAAIWHVLPESIKNDGEQDENGEFLEDEGLHDLHAWIYPDQAATYTGHQQDRVRALGREYDRDLVVGSSRLLDSGSSPTSAQLS